MAIFISPSYRKTQPGFTLIEILVVLLIVTILTGLTVSRLPSFATNADLDTEVRRLQLLLNMARSDAVMDSTEFGFRLNKDGYEFLSFRDDAQRWQLAESPFHAREVDEDIRLTLRVDDKQLSLPGENLPKLLILSSGETTPFELTIESRSRDSEQTLATDGYGEIALKEL